MNIASTSQVVTGKVLWISLRDGNGVIIDSQGNEVYFDSSVCSNFGLIKRNDEVEFKTRRLGSTLCAYDIKKI